MTLMLGWGVLKALLGIGGVGGAGLAARALGWHTRALAAVRRVPGRAWPWIAAAAVLPGLLVFHVIHEHRAFHKAVNEAYAKGVADERAASEKKAASVTVEVAAVTTPISDKARTENDAENRHIHAAADAIRVRGAGAAQCRDPRFSAASGEHPRDAGPGDAALPKLPYPEWSALLAMPVSSAAGFSEQHDYFRARSMTWDKWYNDTYAAWEKLRAEAAKPKR